MPTTTPATTTTPSPTATPATIVQGAILPAPVSSATGPTGVASSALADQTLATQTQGYNNLKTSMDAQAQKVAATPTFNPAVSIVDLLSSKGMPSDYNSRAQLAAKAGITNYVGSAQQNQQLIGYVNNPPKETTTTNNNQNTNTTTNQNTNQNQNTTGQIPAGWDATSYANFKAANPGLEPTPEDTARLQQTGVYTPTSQITDQANSYSKEIADALDQRNAAIDQITNGTFPLTASQQAQVDALKKQFEQIAAQQAIANTSYEGAVALAGNRLGTNIQNPQEYAAEGNKAINDDLQKIANIEATGAKAVAELEQAFQDKNYEHINDSYNALMKALQMKNDAITAAQATVTKINNDQRDYNEKVNEFKQTLDQQKKAEDDKVKQNEIDNALNEKKLALDTAKTNADIAKISQDMKIALANSGTVLDANNPFAKKIKDAMAAIRFPSVNDRNVATTAIMGMVAEGNVAGAQEQLKQYAYNSMSTPDQTTLSGKQDAINALNRIENGLATLKAQGVSTNFLTGLKEKALKKGGFLADPTLNQAAEEVALAIVDYRHAVTGAAFTASEAKTYNDLFPSVGNTPALNSVLINTLKSKFESDIDRAYDSRITGYKDINSSLSSYGSNPLGVSGTVNATTDPLGIF